MPRAETQNMITKWLANHRQSDGGGWAQITDDDVHDLSSIIRALIEEKCDQDADGDHPIQVILVNRRKFRPMLRTFVPYEGEFEEIIPELATAAERAIEQLQTELQGFRLRRNDG